MINILYYYIVIGVIFNLIVEGVMWWLKKNTDFIDTMTDYEKLLAMIFWPLGLVVFLSAFLKEIYGKK